MPALSLEEAGGNGKASEIQLATQADQCTVEVGGCKAHRHITAIMAP